MNVTTTKQKLVIVLKGVPNSGKTTTLNYLIQLLQGIKDLLLLKGDRRVLIPYQDKTVYVATPGDDDDVTKESVELFQKNDYDILVTAAWSWGKTHAPIDKYVLDHGVQVVKVKQRKVVKVKQRKVEERIDEANRAQAQYIKDIDKANRAQAQELKGRIDAFIKQHS